MVPACRATSNSSHLLRRDVALPGEELAHTVRPFPSRCTRSCVAPWPISLSSLPTKDRADADDSAGGSQDRHQKSAVVRCARTQVETREL